MDGRGVLRGAAPFYIWEAAVKYYVKNMVRRVQTRTARHLMAGRAKFTQRILGNRIRLVRGKFHPITEEQLKQCWEELKSKYNKGLIAVHEGAPSGPVFKFDKKEHVQEAKDDEPKNEEKVEQAPKAEVESTKPQQTSEMSAEDIDKMKKSDLVEYASKLLGEDPGVLERMTKNEIKELIR